MKSLIETIEFDYIRDLLSSYCQSEIGRDYFLNLKMLPKEELKKELAILKESINIYLSYGSYPLSPSIDASSLLNKCSSGACLNVEEIQALDSDLYTRENLHIFLSKVDGGEKIKDIESSLEDFSLLHEEINRKITPDGEISDKASPKLRSIRQNIERLKKKSNDILGGLISKYSSITNGNSFAYKDGHFCLPIANSYKSKIKGIIHDISSSGETLFIEPEELLLIHNEIAEAQIEEDKEIFRILLEISTHIGRREEELLHLNKTIGYFDILNAKARLYSKFDCHIANVSDKKEIILLNARHPKIDKKQVVGNDFILSEEYPIMLISGPNAGGKTIALKSVALLTYMHQAALPIPSSNGSEIGYIDNIYVDIGDGQSIEESLSTFASHIKNVSSILKKAKSNDLLILDEIGSGTSPQEGEAIAYACLKEIERKGSFALISSHFQGLKAICFKEGFVKSASMLFDEKELRPTYKMRLGIPGESFAFEVAEKYGLDKRLIEEARDYLGQDKDNKNDGKALLKLIAEQEETKAQLEEEKKAISLKEKRISSLEKELENKKKSYDAALKEKQAKILEETEIEISKIISKLSSSSKLHEAIEAKKEIEGLTIHDEEEVFQDELTVGDRVYIPLYDIYGEIKNIKKDKLDILSEDGLSINVDKNRCKKVEKENKEKPKEDVVIVKAKPVGLELNIIGMRADEAKIALSSYLDSALVYHHERVRIIHGLGSGILRKMTKEYLDSKSFVDHYEMASPQEGGMGATIVYLKK